MAKYIERAAALHAVKNAICSGKCGAVFGSPLFDAINGVPPADVVERKRGEWKIGANYLQCSCCKYDFARLYPRNFCPNCGADMRGETHEHCSDT